MICVSAIEALKEPPRKSAQFVIGKQQADGSWEHAGSTLGAQREKSMSQRCILATAQED